MARYENLPIYKKALELAVVIEEAVRGFPRYHKYALGQDLRTQSRGLVELILRANSRSDKAPLLTELRDQAEAMKVGLMIGKEIKAFSSFKQFEKAATLAVEIARQSEGWLKSQRPKGSVEPANQGKRNLRPESPPGLPP
ncbi:MAG: hypothetical protein A2600_04925 [Candidatus Lambdaproteobacteria bacterium RIFOXYD1_FULL_56_27]|uniref:bAvd-like domain-containing protein n=1 Tax=Candidatus Lambdaproteobacteria bacterium RIFOXYD2_FULL_56_26 TaxID=1817773 RepID=A0A1F6GRY6_9PROT|nr:MAG: hypothetical protein A2426_07780 [Candidatus Lambdaproteobacteria bacterium RIFOXYC1_FULL_56_13]OGH00839.1 MAG: hypothetical protein A2557_03960 [Candidatus Lambdaproteobacteria bacterium RIFOXYD2_FULL_56_26]OGH09896.1 MAG: hypothetical protein A2600_04925 [Candidatus Lambdaproteobacteria bacterium RIFOXYD1_FULL_56_27]